MITIEPRWCYELVPSGSSAHHFGELGRGGPGRLFVPALHHHADHRLGARGAQHHPPSPAIRFSMLRTASCTAGTFAGSKRFATFTLRSTCGNFNIPEASSASDKPVFFITASTCKALTSPSPVVVLSRQMMCPEVSPPRMPPVSRKHSENVTVAHRRPLEFDAAFAQRHLEAEVAHHRADHRTAQRAGCCGALRDDVEQLVAVDQAAEMINHHQAVAVAIERQPDIRAHTRER